MNQNKQKFLQIAADELEYYVYGRRLISRAAIPAHYPTIRRLQTFLGRYAEHLTVYVCGNKYYYECVELEALLRRLDEQFSNE